MSQARATFYDRLGAFNSATQSEVIFSKAPHEVSHNACARLFRNGLAVVGFAIIEDFIKTRTGEVLQRIGNSRVPFSDLPIGIKNAATMGVVSALRFQENLLDKRVVDIHTYYQQHTRLISSTGGSGYEISNLAFGHDKSNLSPSDVNAILEAFCIEKPWSAMGSVASRVGAGVADIKSIFENAASKRHEAAHQASADIETTDLISYGSQVISLAISFDLLLSRALRKILDIDKNYLEQREKIKGNQISIRFISRNSGYWRETVDANSRARERNRDLLLLKSACIQRARANGQSVIVRDERGLPAEWLTPDID